MEPDPEPVATFLEHEPALERAPTKRASEVPPPARSRVAGSVKAELPPVAPKDRQQGGGSGTTRVSALKMTGFENIIDSVFTFDPEAVYQDVLSCLAFAGKASRTDYGSLVDALDASEENARKALQLLANAKVALVNYQADVDVIRGELREQSKAELMREKDASGGKAPTIADIEARMASSYHDEHRDIEQRSAKAKQTVEYLDGLAGLCGQRARDLRQMVASARGT